MPGEKIVAGGSRNGRVYMWDIASGRQIGFPANSDHRVSQCMCTMIARMYINTVL